MGLRRWGDCLTRDQGNSAVRTDDVVPTDATAAFDANRSVGSRWRCLRQLRVRLLIPGLQGSSLLPVVFEAQRSCRHSFLPPCYHATPAALAGCRTACPPAMGSRSGDALGRALADAGSPLPSLGHSRPRSSAHRLPETRIYQEAGCTWIASVAGLVDRDAARSFRPYFGFRHVRRTPEITASASFEPGQRWWQTRPWPKTRPTSAAETSS